MKRSFRAPAHALHLLFVRSGTAVAVLGMAFLLCVMPAASAIEDAGRSDTIDAVAREFVVLGLLHFRHDTGTHLYIGPEDLKTAADGRGESLSDVRRGMARLRARIAALPEAISDLGAQRRRDLDDRIVAFMARASILLGEPPASFDEETRLLFGVEAPHYDEAHFSALVGELDALLPGSGDLALRAEQFRSQFVIPPDRLESVIGTAMRECRRRTLAQLDLPEGEQVELHIDHDQPWVGFTFYRGSSFSDIHLNADVPVHIERALELGCHEGYPGHHVHASLLEQHLIKERGWVEYSLITLFGPLAVVAEGAASHALDLVFDRQERLIYEREVLMPLAGLDSAELELYYHYIELIEALNYARNEVARKYLYEGMPKDEAIEWLMAYGLETRGTATQRLDFIEAMRSYVITYNVGRRLVREYIERTAGDDSGARWQSYRDILLAPLLPADLLHHEGN